MEDDGYYNEERVLSDDYVKVTYKGNTAVLPRVIKRGELKKLNRDFESIIMGPNRKRLFSKAAHACEKQAAALAEYRLSRNPDAFSYMKKKCRDMAIRYIEEKTQEEFVEFLKLGTVSNKIIPELLSIASKKEKTIVVAYLMERLGKSNNTQEVFDKAIDDTSVLRIQRFLYLLFCLFFRLKPIDIYIIRFRLQKTIFWFCGCLHNICNI